MNCGLVQQVCRGQLLQGNSCPSQKERGRFWKEVPGLAFEGRVDAREMCEQVRTLPVKEGTALCVQGPTGDGQRG